MTESRQIDQSTYLQALALFVMSAERYRETRVFERELSKLLGVEEFGHISDAIYDENGGDAEKRLNDALAREGIAFAPVEPAQGIVTEGQDAQRLGERSE